MFVFNAKQRLCNVMIKERVDSLHCLCDIHVGVKLLKQV